MKVRRHDLAGKQFGQLYVIERSGTRNGHPEWRVRCSCGEVFETELRVVKEAATKNRCTHQSKVVDWPCRFWPAMATTVKRPTLVPVMSKLTESAVVEMRARHASGESIPEIAKSFGVTTGTAGKAIRRVSWKMVA